MEKRKILFATAVTVLLALSCATLVFADESSAADPSATKDGVTVTYELEEKRLHFSFGADSKIKGDNVFTTINGKEWGKLNLLNVPYISFEKEEQPSAFKIKMVQSNTVELTVYVTGYVINLIQPANGTITADKSTADAGVTVNLTATPASGYVFVKWITTPTTAVIDNSFTMQEHDVTVTAEFTPTVTAHLVSPVAEGSGTVTASQASAIPGATVTLTVTPVSSEYEFKEWKNKNPSTLQITKVAENKYQFQMPNQDVSMKAVFGLASVHAYSVTATPADGGSISSASGSAKAGTTIMFTVTPNAGYTIGSVTSSQVTITNNDNVYAFTMPSEDVKVSVVFKAIPTYGITVSGTNGTVASDCQKAYEGQTVTLTLSPNSGYVFDKWATVTPSSLEIIKSGTDKYTFTMPASAVTVKASFKQQTDITKDVANGSISIKLDSDVTVDSVVGLIIDSGYAKQINIPKDAKTYTVTSTVKTDGKDVDLSKKSITLKLKYSIPAGKTADDIRAYYVSDDGTIVERQISTYQNGYVAIESADGTKLSESTYTIVTEQVLPVPTDVIGVRDGANGFVSIEIGGSVTKSTTLDLSIKKVSPSLKNIPSNATTYDVSLTAKNGGTKLDLSGNTVMLYLDPGQVSTSKMMYVYYVSNDGKTLEKMTASLTEDNEVMFKVTHFSLYVISPTEIQPLEDDSALPIIIGIVTVLIVLMVAVILVSKRKTKGES